MSIGDYHKRYFKTLSELFGQFKKVREAQRILKTIDAADRISPDFAEKIMLAVTGVNDCVNCSYRHTKSALKTGVGLDEAVSILKGDLGGFPEKESVGLVYAQHWADNIGDPDSDAREKVVDYYGAAKTAHMEMFMQMVCTGNLISNTVEAYKSKVRPKTGRFGFFVTYLLCRPIAFLIKSNTRSVQKALQGKLNSVHGSRGGNR